jgi:hypothetical protein
MVTKRLKALAKVRLISNGSLGFVVGFVHGDLPTPHYGNVELIDTSIFEITDDLITGVKIYKFKKQPQLILLKIRNCNRQLVKDYPVGVVGIPTTTATVHVQLPHTKKVASMKITQFPMIAAHALTPEKLQGKCSN